MAKEKIECERAPCPTSADPTKGPAETSPAHLYLFLPLSPIQLHVSLRVQHRSPVTLRTVAESAPHRCWLDSLLSTSRTAAGEARRPCAMYTAGERSRLNGNVRLTQRRGLTLERNSFATMRPRALVVSFIELISLSTSSMNWMIKSTSLCLYMASVWKFVIRKLIS